VPPAPEAGAVDPRQAPPAPGGNPREHGTPEHGTPERNPREHGTPEPGTRDGATPDGGQ
jgi:hypothetical protein